MTPSPFGGHGQLVAKISAALTNAIDHSGSGSDSSVLIEVDWIVSRDTVWRPDVTDVCGPPPQRHIESPPAMVVEVLSDATLKRDLNFKRKIFEEESVPCYLIGDPEDDSLQVLRLNEQGAYQEVAAESELKVDICDVCELNVKLDRLFR